MNVKGCVVPDGIMKAQFLLGTHAGHQDLLWATGGPFKKKRDTCGLGNHMWHHCGKPEARSTCLHCLRIDVLKSTAHIQATELHQVLRAPSAG